MNLYVIYTVLAGILWGIISVFVRTLTALGFSSMQVLFARGLVSSLMMLVFILIKDRKLLKIHWKDLWMFVGTGVISLSFFSFCYITTINNIGTSIAVILLYTSPIFVLLFSMVLFKEKITLIKIIALVLTFAGCILVAGVLGGAEKISLKGFLVGICAGLGYALYSIFSRYALKKYSSITVTFYTFVFSSFSVIPLCHIQQMPALINTKAILFICGISLFCTVLPYILYTKGLSGLETGKAAILVTVEPLVGSLIGIFLWKEAVGITKIIGIICIFAAVIMLGINGNQQTEKDNDE